MEFWLSDLMSMVFGAMGFNSAELKSGGLQSKEQQNETTSALVWRQRESYA
jgi:hypothetical protein